MKRLLIIIPAYNEEAKISSTIEELRHISMPGIKIDLVVVNDGSTDRTKKITSKKRLVVIHHIINRGLGAALSTGFSYALMNNYDFVMTFDADGQHSARNIITVINPLLRDQVDVVIGSRLLSPHGMPKIRYLINLLSNFVTFMLFNIWTTDSQSGMRAFTLRALKRMHIKSQRMEVSSEILKEISRLKLKYCEVPIKSVYTKYSLSKGQKISNAPNVFWKLMLQRFS